MSIIQPAASETELASLNSPLAEAASETKPTPDLRLQQAAELIERIYYSINHADRWCQAIDALAESLGASGWAIWTGENCSPENGRVTTTMLDQQKVHDYASTFAAENPLFKKLENRSSASLYTSDQLLPRDEYVKHQYYRDVWKPAGLTYSMGGYISRDTKRFCIFWFYRGNTQPFQPQDVQLLEFLRPHLAQAMKIRDEVQRLNIRARAGMQTLDRLKTAMIMLDSEGRPVASNDYAESFIQENVIRIQQDSLSLPGSKPGCLKRLIEQAHQVNFSATLLNDGFKVIAGHGETGNVELLVLPYEQKATIENSLAAPIHTVVFLKHAGVAPTPAMPYLRELFGLTAAEGRVCLALLTGKSTRDIAAEKGLSLETVRFHCKSILQKTGNSRRSDLIQSLCLSMVNLTGDQEET